MFIRSRTWYKGGEQQSSGPYIVLVSHPDFSSGNRELRYCVRRCAMHQCGQFMMGLVRIGRKSVTVSGSHGNDGLPLNPEELPDGWYQRLELVPPEASADYWGGTDGSFHRWIQGFPRQPRL